MSCSCGASDQNKIVILQIGVVTGVGQKVPL